MTQVYGALLLLVVYFGTALLTLLISHDLGKLLFWNYCDAANLLSDPCQAAAATVAAQGFVASALVAVVTIGFTQKSLRDRVVSPSIDPFEASPALVLLLLATVAVVLTLHYSRHPTEYRAADSAIVSIESLTWPLLLQLIFWSQQVRWKFVLVCFLAAIVVISPFRNTLFSILYFGALVPFSAMFAINKAFSRQTRIFGLVATTLLVLLISVIVVYQTGHRGGQNEAGSTLTRIPVIGQALALRAFTPFFGAVFLDDVVRSGQALPPFFATIERKFKVTNLDLNEYAYKILYGGEGLYQETPLYYGESIANTSISPIFWQFAAPLALVLSYFLLRPVCDIGTLIAIQLWRGSMGGLSDILPALILQIGFCIILSFLNKSRSQ